MVYEKNIPSYAKVYRCHNMRFRSASLVTVPSGLVDRTLVGRWCAVCMTRVRELVWAFFHTVVCAPWNKTECKRNKFSTEKIIRIDLNEMLLKIYTFNQLDICCSTFPFNTYNHLDWITNTHNLYLVHISYAYPFKHSIQNTYLMYSAKDDQWMK